METFTYTNIGTEGKKPNSFTFSNAARRTWAWPVTSTTTAKRQRAVLVKPWKQSKYKTTPSWILVHSQFLNCHLFYFHLLLQFRTFLILSSGWFISHSCRARTKPCWALWWPYPDMSSSPGLLQTIPLFSQRVERENKTKHSVRFCSPLKLLFLITWIYHGD